MRRVGSNALIGREHAAKEYAVDLSLFGQLSECSTGGVGA